MKELRVEQPKQCLDDAAAVPASPDQAQQASSNRSLDLLQLGIRAAFMCWIIGVVLSGYFFVRSSDVSLMSGLLFCGLALTIGVVCVVTTTIVWWRKKNNELKVGRFAKLYIVLIACTLYFTIAALLLWWEKQNLQSDICQMGALIGFIVLSVMYGIDELVTWGIIDI